MKQVKHLHWSNGLTGSAKKGGRLVVAYNELSGTLIIKQLAGQAPYARMLPDILGKGLDPATIREANESHAQRQLPHAVEARKGMSGCVDYLLRSLRDEKLNDAPIRSRVHVSMNAKLNRTIKIFIGDLPPIFTKMGEEGEFRVPTQEIDQSGEILWSIDEVGQFQGDFSFRQEEKLGFDEGGSIIALKADELAPRTVQRIEALKF